MNPAKEAVRHTVGVVPAFEYKLKVTRAPQAWKLKQQEDAEVARALETVGFRPVAEVVTIIPTHNRPEMLLEAVASALDQTVTDHHVVVIDDGAGLPKLPNDERLTAFSLSKNTGVAGVVRNVGIRISSSTYLAFLDDDNIWKPDHLEISLKAHDRGADFTYTAIERVDENNNRIDVLSVPFSKHAMRSDGFVDMNAVVVRRTPHVIFSRIRRNFGEFPKEDWELTWRLSRYMNVEHIPIPTVTYRVHSGSHFTNWNASPFTSA